MLFLWKVFGFKGERIEMKTKKVLEQSLKLSDYSLSEEKVSKAY